MVAMARRLSIPLSDVLLALVVLTSSLASLVVVPDFPGFRRPDVWAFLLGVSQALPLVVRRRFPLGVLAAVWLATLAYLIAGYPPITPPWIAAVVATYSVAAHSPKRQSWIGAGVSAGALLSLLLSLAFGQDVSIPEAGFFASIFAVAWILGDRMKTRRAYVGALEERARHLELERELQAEAVAAAERARIARELHDVVAHGVTVIVLHAQGSREVMEGDPEAARRSLDLIETTGRGVLEELRTVLGALRSDGDSPEPLHPQRGLAALGELAEELRATGLDVEILVEREKQSLPAAVDLSAYRVVQEALTNTLRHSTARQAQVAIRFEPEQLIVHVTDEGRPVSGDGRAGLGLRGMRERIVLLGGRFQAGPRADGGYEVMAVLPVRGMRS